MQWDIRYEQERGGTRVERSVCEVWGEGIAYDRHALDWPCGSVPLIILTLPLTHVPTQRIIYFLLMPCAQAYTRHEKWSSFYQPLHAKVT